MRALKAVYKVFRSMIMSLIVLAAVVYMALYVVLSVPAVQEKVKARVCMEATRLLGGRIEIGRLAFRPFSEVVLTDVSLLSPSGEKCAEIGKVGAGVDLWATAADRRIVLNYAEIIGLDAKLVQPAENSPLNIQFLIDALSPKDRTNPPTLFDVRIRNVVVRNSKASFSRPWMADSIGIGGKPADVELSNLRVDLSIPALRNDLFKFDVRNMQFDVTPGVSLRSLTAHVTYVKDTPGGENDRLLIEGLKMEFPRSALTIGDLDLQLKSLKEMAAEVNGTVTPSDFSAFSPHLDAFDTPWQIGVEGSMKGKSLTLHEFLLENEESGSNVRIKGGIKDFNSKDSLDVNIDLLHVDLGGKILAEALAFLPKSNDKAEVTARSVGRLEIDLDGNLRNGSEGEVKGKISTAIGSLDLKAKGKDLLSKRPRVAVAADAENLDLGLFLAIEKIGKISAQVEAEVAGFDRHAEGNIKLHSDEFELMGNLLTGIDAEARKDKDDIDLTLDVRSKEMEGSLDGYLHLGGVHSRLEADVSVSGFRPSDYGIKGKMADAVLNARVSASVRGSNPDNATGKMRINDFSLSKRDGSRLTLMELNVTVDSLMNFTEPAPQTAGNPVAREIKLESDWLDARMAGYIHPSNLEKELKGMAATVFPTLMASNHGLSVEKGIYNDFTFEFNIKGTPAPYEFFSTPVRPLTDIPVAGRIDARDGQATLKLSTPHLQQGKNKLIRDLDFNFSLDSNSGMASVNTSLIFPAKKGDAQIAADIAAVRDKVNINIGLNPTMESVVKGGIGLAASFSRIPDPFKPQGELWVRLDILPSTVMVNDKAWTIGQGAMDYCGRRVSIDNFIVRHEDQYVRINGTASESAEDMVKVKINDIDLEYIFNLLNINYVSFGGMATGEVVGSRLLTKAPEARTQYLRVKRLSYNGAVLGDGDLASEYYAKEQKVGIYAVIRDSLTRERRASIDGDIWVTRDSLSFGFDANKVNVGIMKPFVSAFCSDLYGAASGKCRLFGSFSDIDLTGALKADTLSMKLDFTNTWYHAGGDSVYLTRGEIDIPPLTLYDDHRNSAEFSGWLKHRYFHDPVFNFRLRDARSLLCYDTNERLNPLWYGTIYGSGHAQITGTPGLIEIDMNMTTEEGSKFYYVISDAEDVAQYSFLTFTDRRKESIKSATKESEPDYLMRFRKQTDDMEASSSNVILSIKGTVTNDALVTLVMDPRAGDNITARGQGALQMDYNLASNDLRMMGTYILDEGNYNFTLQDIIIKNFNIRKGSLIKFDGDPMKALLDITATYRVNTNLTDLDKSFSTDRELNRTNVPVDAVLLVDGPMTNPDITFDIELPSLTSDVERKVKSIVSTNDMMNRQIIYLLALNRFYTPEYTGGQSNGSEWSSMASSTISSQLSNMLSQLTDKLNVAPSFRSEKGNFSDMEFDLALSSRLLNNRLLINGNFGYRDKNTSNTQFVGDFDIEYLLSKNGNLRLKAYNHFNDQNYYLRSALTTQGVGLVFRRDFDRLFGRKEEDNVKETPKAEDRPEDRTDSTSIRGRQEVTNKKDKENDLELR